MLPFLKPKGWPTKAKITGESKYGFSEDDELSESALDELLHAYHSKDSSSLIAALMALIELIQSKESHAPTHEES